MFVALMGMSINTSIQGTNFSISGITALASGNTYDNMELTSKTCWTTGETILYCTYGTYVCDASDQGSCS